MLELTGAAADSIRRLVADLPSGAGLRVALEKPGNGTEPEFSLCVVRGPESEDEVVEQKGARVFVDSAASAYFEDKVLDADEDTFTFAPASETR
jgi:iron-sulfur cluster assembly protein